MQNILLIFKNMIDFKKMSFTEIQEYLSQFDEEEHQAILEEHGLTAEDLFFLPFLEDPALFFEKVFQIAIVDEQDNILGHKPFIFNRPQKRLMKTILKYTREYFLYGTGFDRLSIAIVKARQIGMTTFICHWFVYKGVMELHLKIPNNKLIMLPTDKQAKKIFKKNIVDPIMNMSNIILNVAGNEVLLLDFLGIHILSNNTENITIAKNGIQVVFENSSYMPDKIRGSVYSDILLDESSDLASSDDFVPAIEASLHNSSCLFINGTAKNETSPEFGSKPNILKKYALDTELFKTHIVFLSPWYEIPSRIIKDSDVNLCSYIANDYYNKYDLGNVKDLETDKIVAITTEQLNWINSKYIAYENNKSRLNNEYPVDVVTAFESSVTGVFYPTWLNYAGKIKFETIFPKAHHQKLNVIIGIDVGGVGGEGADKTVMCINYENKYFKFIDISVDPLKKGSQDHNEIADYVLNFCVNSPLLKNHRIQCISIDSAGVGNPLYGMVKNKCKDFVVKINVKPATFGTINQNDYGYMHEYSKAKKRYYMGRDLMIDNIRQLFLETSSNWHEQEDGSVLGTFGIDYESSNGRIKEELSKVQQEDYNRIKYTDADDLRTFLKGKSADYLSAMMCSVAYKFNDYETYQNSISQSINNNKSKSYSTGIIDSMMYR